VGYNVEEGVGVFSNVSALVPFSLLQHGPA
jgi:hypothetical protein